MPSASFAAATLIQRFGLVGVPSAPGPFGALAPVRAHVDDSLLRMARDAAPPEKLHVLLAPLQLEVEAFLQAGGKRLRAIALLSAYTAWADRRDRDEQALTAAAAIELLHAFMLAHDDLVDRSNTRRGEPTLHRRLGRVAAANPESTLGDDLSLIAGDLLHAQAHRVMALTPWPADRAQRLLGEWFEMVMATGFGQWADTLNDGAALARLDASDILAVAEAKTAHYTLAGPMCFGAILAGAPAAAVEALGTYGRALGTAFQIRDDLMDLCDPLRLGKETADDLGRGRISVPLAIALERSHPADAERLRALCSGDDTGSLHARRAWVLQLVEKTEAIAAAQDLVDVRVADALRAIEALDTPQVELWRLIAASITADARPAVAARVSSPIPLRAAAR